MERSPSALIAKPAPSIVLAALMGLMWMPRNPAIRRFCLLHLGEFRMMSLIRGLMAIRTTLTVKLLVRAFQELNSSLPWGCIIHQRTASRNSVGALWILSKLALSLSTGWQLYNSSKSSEFMKTVAPWFLTRPNRTRPAS